MNMPIRVIDIVTSIIWVLLIAVVALSAYSIKDLGFELYKPTATVTQNSTIVLSVPVRVINMGYSDMKPVTVTTTLLDAEGSEITKTSTLLDVLPRLQNVSLVENLTLSAALLAEKGEQYFAGYNFTISVSVGSTFGGFLPAELSTNFVYQFNASFSSLSLRPPAVGVSASTSEKATAAVSFDNYASAEVSENMRAGTDTNREPGVIPRG